LYEDGTSRLSLTVWLWGRTVWKLVSVQLVS